MTYEHPPEEEPQTVLEELLSDEIVAPLAAGIDASIEAAEIGQRQLTNTTARNIAYLLSRTVASGTGSLAQLAEADGPSGELAHQAALEAAPIGADREVPRDLARWIGWLATWAISRQEDRRAGEAVPSGDAFHAYLLLPDVDPEDPDLLERFLDDYVGAYDNVSALTSGLSDIDQWSLLIDQFASTHGIGEFVKLDRDRIAKQILQVYDIVAIRGKLYAFSK